MHADSYCQVPVCVCVSNDGVFVCSCVEILISEQFRRYNEKMQNIQELEYAEAQAVNQLKLRRQNTVSDGLVKKLPSKAEHYLHMNLQFNYWTFQSLLPHCFVFVQKDNKRK